MNLNGFKWNLYTFFCVISRWFLKHSWLEMSLEDIFTKHDPIWLVLIRIDKRRAGGSGHLHSFFGYDFAVIPLRSFQIAGGQGDGGGSIDSTWNPSIMSKIFEKKHTHTHGNPQCSRWTLALAPPVQHRQCNTPEKKAISKEQQRRTELIRKNSSVVPDYLNAGPRFSAGFWTFWHGVANKMKILLDTQLV